MACLFRIQLVLHNPGGGIAAGYSGHDEGYLRCAGAFLGAARSHHAVHHTTSRSDMQLIMAHHRSCHHSMVPLVHHTGYPNSGYKAVVRMALTLMDHEAFHWYRTTM